MNEKLVFDVGMHTGRDTDFYLKKGFSVVAIEASPTLVKHAEHEFSRALASGQLILHPVAISDRSGEVEFYDLRVDPGAQRNLGADHREAGRHAAYIAASSPAQPPSEKVEIDSDTRQQLQELGYLPGDE